MPIKASSFLLATTVVLSALFSSMSLHAETDDERFARMAGNAEFYKLVKRVMPEYPDKALRYNREGHVVVEYSINTDGSVTSPKVIEAVPEALFDEAALAAVKKWKYQPNFSGGEPDMALARTRIRFSP